MRITQGCFFFLPDLTDARMSKQARSIRDETRACVAAKPAGTRY